MLMVLLLGGHADNKYEAGPTTESRPLLSIYIVIARLEPINISNIHYNTTAKHSTSYWVYLRCSRIRVIQIPRNARLKVTFYGGQSPPRKLFWQKWDFYGKVYVPCAIFPRKSPDFYGKKFTYHKVPTNTSFYLYQYKINIQFSGAFQNRIICWIFC